MDPLKFQTILLETHRGCPTIIKPESLRIFPFFSPPPSPLLPPATTRTAGSRVGRKVVDELLNYFSYARASRRSAERETFLPLSFSFVSPRLASILNLIPRVSFLSPWQPETYANTYAIARFSIFFYISFSPYIRWCSVKWSLLIPKCVKFLPSCFCIGGQILSN